MVPDMDGEALQLVVEEFLRREDIKTDMCLGLMKLLCYGGHIPQIQLLLKAGADVNGEDPSGVSILHVAAMRSPQAVRLLLTAGANINKVDKEGRTPLKLATEAGNTEIVRILLEAGAQSS